MISISYSKHFQTVFKKRIKENKIHAELFLEEVELFKTDPFHPSLNTHKLTGTLQGYWSFSIDDDLRVVFYFPPKTKWCLPILAHMKMFINMKNPLLKILFRNGLIGGVLGCIALATFYYIGRHPFLFAPYFDFRIVIFSVFIFMGLKEVRDYYQQGYLSFFQGMIGSYVFIITSALIGSVFTLAIASYDSKFISTYIEKMNEEMVLLKTEFIESMGEKVYQLQLQKLQSTSAFDLASDYFLKSLIIGLFLAIIISVILRKQPKTN